MSNKYSIVTGASRGLGAAIAEELAREGYDVVITYCTQADKAQKVKKQLETKFGVRVESYQLDIKDEEAVLAFRKWAEETLGTNLQVLVNNAGIYANIPAEEIASETFCDIIDVNVKGTFFMTRHFVDLMIANHYGKIINLCSAVGLRAAPGSIAYASSKFAVRGMTQALALDLGKYNIQVNAIAPGAHKTDMYWDAYKIDPELLEKRTKGCPLQRAGEVSEMVGSLFGFVSVVQTLPEFQAILNYIFSLNMAPFLVLILSINIVGALTGSSSSAIRIGMPMAMQHCIDAGMSLAFVQRLGAFAASILDTLPHSSAIIINLGIADQDMKEAYPPMAVTTILTTAVGTAAVAIFMSLFPSLP